MRVGTPSRVPERDDAYRERRRLHDAALATVTGEPLAAPGGTARVLEVVLAVYSVAVFATLAAALGAYFLGRGPLGPQAAIPPPQPVTGPGGG